MSEQVLVKETGHEGKYVALRSFEDNSIVTSGDDPVEVFRAAKSQGVESPVLFFVNKGDVTYLY